MIKLSISLLAATALLMFNACSDSSQTKKEEATTYKYNNAQVYENMCVNCHGKQGEGVAELDKNGKPKGPALNKQEIYELKLAITDIKNGGLNQSSGTDHEIMEHNYKAIKKKGMDYDTDSMAEYIYNTFNINK
ncbi:MAG: hypothetical protein JXK05_04340 [Campylobacterales bacterium]|nr:hypothetical protein [Campylobacterales bacterium]